MPVGAIVKIPRKNNGFQRHRNMKPILESHVHLGFITPDPMILPTTADFIKED
jgi:hypothetical protein